MATIISGHISNERLLHFSLWTAQAVLASVFAAMALLKLLSEPERLVEMMTWTASLPSAVIWTLAIVELLGAVAVAAPAVTETPQRIVGWTAVGFILLMTYAATVHVMYGQLKMVALNVALAGLAAFVAWGRLSHKPLETSDGV